MIVTDQTLRDPAHSVPSALPTDQRSTFSDIDLWWDHVATVPTLTNPDQPWPTLTNPDLWSLLWPINEKMPKPPALFWDILFSEMSCGSRLYKLTKNNINRTQRSHTELHVKSSKELDVRFCTSFPLKNTARTKERERRVQIYNKFL